MVSTQNKRKSAETKTKDMYKTIRLLTFFVGILFLIVGLNSLARGDPPGALLNGFAGLLFFLASYTFFRNKDKKNK